MRPIFICTSLLALAACHQAAEKQQPANESETSEVASSQLKGVHREHRGTPVPAAVFADPDGNPAKLANFAGKPLLVNLWASWCAPCVKELPTLDRLDKTGKIQVLAVSQDDGPHPSVVAFLQAHKIATLKSYQDSKMALSGALGPDTVLPTSILFDANGKEVWRYVGDLDWTSPEAAKLLAEAGEASKSS